MENLSYLILREVGKRGCTITCFAELCGLSRNEVSKIVNRSKKDVNVSTVLKICENSGISLEDVFGAKISDKNAEKELEKRFEKELSKFYLTNGSAKYYIRKF